MRTDRDDGGVVVVSLPRIIAFGALVRQATGSAMGRSGVITLGAM